MENSLGQILSGTGTGTTGLPGESNQYYQTIQSNQQLHNVSSEDPAYLTNQNIINSYNQQIGNNRVVPSGFDNHSVIMEQQYEDEEERGRTPQDRNLSSTISQKQNA